MYVADMHCDSLHFVSAERGLVTPYNISKSYPSLQFFAHFSRAEGKTPEERRARLMKSLNVYLYECERLGIFKVTTSKDVFDALDSKGKSAVFSIEGGGGLFADSPELDTLYRAGLRILGMAWDKNELSASAFDNEDDTGLTDEGRKMLARCAQLGITLDLSHLSDRAFWEAFELSPMPHIATHSNFREVTPHRRNLTRDMALAIANRGGIIGINIYPNFISDTGEPRIEDALRHIDYGLELVGEDALGFGFDIDGTYGKYPIGVDEQSSIHDRVIDLLLSRYSASTVEKIAGLNVMEFLKDNLV